MKISTALIGALVVYGASVFAQERTLLPPPPPMRNPMLIPNKVVPLPPSLGATLDAGGQSESEPPGWIMRRGNSGKWQVLWQGRWVGKNQMLGDEKITNIDEYGIEVQGPSGKRNIPVVGINLGRQQKGHK